MLDRLSAITGHTLFELLAALSLVAMLAGISWPTFAGWLLDSRRDASVRTAVHAVHVARGLAAVRGDPVELCGSDDGAGCSGRGEWTTGLLVISGDRRVVRNLPLPVAIRVPRLHSNRAIIRFEAGTSFASPATISVCDRRGPAAARAVIVSRSGRPRVSGRDAGDGPIPC